MSKLIWKWEDEEEDGEGVGPWWIDDDEQSPTWVRRSDAERIANAGGHEFVADE